MQVEDGEREFRP